MARKPDVSPYKSFDQIADRLDEIIFQVRDKDTSLERSLALVDEALALGSKAVDLVDTTDFSPAELERLETMPAQNVSPQQADSAPAGDASKEKED